MNKVILILFLTITAFFFSQESHAQENRDVVHLKNGGMIKVIIIEQVPNEILKIETADGSIFVYKMDEVEKITKEITAKRNNNPLQNTPTSNARKLEPALSFFFSFNTNTTAYGMKLQLTF